MSTINFNDYKRRKEEEKEKEYEQKEMDEMGFIPSETETVGIITRIKRAIGKKMNFSKMVAGIVKDVRDHKYDKRRAGTNGRRIMVYMYPDYEITLGDIKSIISDNDTRTYSHRIREIRYWEGCMSDALQEYCRQHDLEPIEMEFGDCENW